MATTTAKTQAKSNASALPMFVIPIAFVIAYLIYKFVFGAPGNFVDNDPNKDPLNGNYLGTIYKGGWVVPVLMTCFLTALIFTIERFITLGRASGTGNVDAFVQQIKKRLDNNDIQGAIADCDKQKGSVGNVVRAGLEKYAQMERDTTLDRDQKVMAIQKELEEATTLELPMLEKNLNILATLTSLGTLVGLFGTVLGMIRSFAALSAAGAPDATALATGISEALINTALGIGTSAIAMIAYNYFTARIDATTYRIDEAGFSLAQTFAANHK